MYKVKTFFNFASKSMNAEEYAKWLEAIQKAEDIEIVSVTSIKDGIMVTYKHLPR